MAGMKWRCPHCNYFQTVTDESVQQISSLFTIKNEEWPSQVGSYQSVVGCSNEECAKTTVSYSIRAFEFVRGSGYVIDFEPPPIYIKRLLPESTAIPQPDCIPSPLREDYQEACLIKDLSPKASATLARRCLQGMIRDFCQIAKKTLDQEIKALREAVADGKAPLGVSPDSVEAIDNVRGVGNIGAHMETDIDHIVPVDPDEAQVLIELIESLFDEWYVARDTRTKRFEAVATLAAEKKRALADLRARPL